MIIAAIAPTIVAVLPGPKIPQVVILILGGILIGPQAGRNIGEPAPFGDAAAACERGSIRQGSVERGGPQKGSLGQDLGHGSAGSEGSTPEDG